MSKMCYIVERAFNRRSWQYAAGKKVAMWHFNKRSISCFGKSVILTDCVLLRVNTQAMLMRLQIQSIKGLGRTDFVPVQTRTIATYREYLENGNRRIICQLGLNICSTGAFYNARQGGSSPEASP